MTPREQLIEAMVLADPGVKNREDTSAAVRNLFRKDAARALDAILAAGWRVVPKVITSEMLAEAQEFISRVSLPSLTRNDITDIYDVLSLAAPDMDGPSHEMA